MHARERSGGSAVHGHGGPPPRPDRPDGPAILTDRDTERPRVQPALRNDDAVIRRPPHAAVPAAARAPLAPTPFAIAEAPAPTERPAAARLAAWLPFFARLGVIAACFALGLAALAIVPRYFPPRADPPSFPTAPALAGPPPAPAVVEPDYASPAAKAERRLAMQKLLAELVAREADLERREAGTWARAALAAAAARRADGERAYSEARYAAAEAHYRDARRQYEAIAQQAKPAAEALVAAGDAALGRGDGPAATQAFETALAIVPELAAAKHGLARAGTLDQVLALRAEAAGYEKLGDRDQALARYRRILKLDPETPAVADALARLEAAENAERYQAAMSAGYAALSGDRLDSARGEFARARTLAPDAADAARALAEVDDLIAARRIAALAASAAALERAERWAEAARAHRALLALDGTLDPAPAVRAANRAALDGALDAAIADPARLVDESGRRDAAARLEEARRVPAPGKRLAAQIARLDHALRIAREPVAVAIASDGATEVSVSRMGTLGRFMARTASLLPGRYTATGRRDGCRDVSIEFVVLAGKPGQTVNVACESCNP